MKLNWGGFLKMLLFCAPFCAMSTYIPFVLKPDRYYNSSYTAAIYLMGYIMPAITVYACISMLFHKDGKE